MGIEESLTYLANNGSLEEQPQGSFLDKCKINLYGGSGLAYSCLMGLTMYGYSYVMGHELSAEQTSGLLFFGLHIPLLASLSIRAIYKQNKRYEWLLRDLETNGYVEKSFGDSMKTPCGRKLVKTVLERVNLSEKYSTLEESFPERRII